MLYSLSGLLCLFKFWSIKRDTLLPTVPVPFYFILPVYIKEDLLVLGILSGPVCSNFVMLVNFWLNLTLELVGSALADGSWCVEQLAPGLFIFLRMAWLVRLTLPEMLACSMALWVCAAVMPFMD